jgi:hypothetical protein
MIQVPKAILSLLISALVLSMVFPGYAASAASEAKAYETKAPQIRVALSRTSVQAGDTFEAAFWLQGFLGEYSGIEGFELRAEFDPEFIQPIVDTDNAAFQSRIFPEESKPITWTQSVDFSGSIRFAQSLPPQSAAGHFSGNGKIGTITFQAVKEGLASIKLNNTIIIKPGNPGVNIKHSFNSPSIAIGAVKEGADVLSTVGDPPKATAGNRSEEQILKVFTDEEEIAKVPWAWEAIAALTEYGAVQGMPNGEFVPLKPMTRGEFAQLAVTALGLNMQQHSAPTFSDIRPSDWFYDAVETAAESGLIGGYELAEGGKEFRPQHGITRAEIASIFSKYLTLEKKTPPSTQEVEHIFGDVPPHHWAWPYVSHLFQLGIVNGKSENEFDPDAATTRAEGSVLLHKLLLNLK